MTCGAVAAALCKLLPQSSQRCGHPRAARTRPAGAPGEPHQETPRPPPCGAPLSRNPSPKKSRQKGRWPKRGKVGIEGEGRCHRFLHFAPKEAENPRTRAPSGREHPHAPLPAAAAPPAPPTPCQHSPKVSMASHLKSSRLLLPPSPFLAATAHLSGGGDVAEFSHLLSKSCRE